MKKLYFILIPIFIFIHLSKAQNPFIVRYSVSNGLPSNIVFSVNKDREGFMYLGTKAGLVRSDGSHFVLYADENNVGNNWIVRLKEDLSGRIWTLNHNGTVNYFYKNILYTSDNTPFLKDLETDFFFHNFFQDKDSTIYFYNSASEIFVVKNNELVDYFHFKYKPVMAGLLYFEKSPDGEFRLWTSSGIYSCRNLNDSLKLDKFFIVQKVYKKDKNTNFVLDADGNVHLYKNGVLFKKNYFKSESQLIYDILVDNDSLIWVSTYDKGLYCYKKDSIILYVDIKRGQTLSLDNENNIWVSSSVNGVFKINRKILDYKFLSKLRFDNSGITDLAPANNGGVWATNGSSLFYVSGYKLFPKRFDVEGDILDNIIELKNSDIILSGVGTNAWYLTDIKLDKKKETLSYKKKKIQLYMSNVVTDSTNQFLYASVNDNLITVDLLNRKQFSYKHLRRGRIKKLFVNNKNRLHVSIDRYYQLTDSGLFANPLYDPLTDYTIQSYISIDADKELFCIEGGDILLLSSGSFYNLTKQFRSQIDYQIKDMIYFDNKLFFFTIKSIYCIVNPLNISSNKPVSLNRLNLEFNNINDLLGRDSLLYVGSDNGLTCIPLKQCMLSPIANIKPYFYKVLLGDKVYDFSSGVVEYKNKKRLSIEFSSLNYSSIPSNYSYMLDGVDRTWTNGKETKVVYLNLAPGKYKFKLRSRINRGEYSNPVELLIIVRPTVFQMVITQVFIVLFSLLLVVIIVRFFYLKKLKQKEIDHMLITLEHRALQSMMNPHFIFNALGSIQGYLLHNKSSEASIYLSQFARLIRQNMNSLKSNFICIEDEVDRLRNYLELEKLRMNNKFTYDIVVGENVDSYDVCIPSMVIQPFVENAIWHGISPLEKGGEIKIKIDSIDASTVVVYVEDNGVGFKNADPDKNKGLNMGVSLTRKRLAIIGERHRVKSGIYISDLNQEKANPGTRVKIIIPVVNCG